MKKFHGFLKPWEVSKYLGIPLEQVEEMIASKELPSMIIDGDVRVSWDKLEAWLDEEVDETELGKLGKRLEKSDQDVEKFVKDQQN